MFLRQLRLRRGLSAGLGRVSFAWVWGACLLLSNLAVAAPVTIELRSGRQLTGEVDDRSNATTLCLRSEGPRHRLVRTFRWNDVLAVRNEQGPLTPDEALALATPNSGQLLWRPLTPPATQPIDVPVPLPGASEFVDPSGAGGLVRAIYIDAFVANWNADVVVDGLVVTLLPVDRFGQVVAIGGTFEIELYGLRADTLRRPSSVDRLGHWSIAVTPDRFGPEGFVFELPFQGVQPEFDTSVAAVGLVSARLSVPGHGVYQASQTDVRLRPYSAFRDRLQQRTRSRFLPSEITGGSTLRNTMPSR